MLQSHEMFIRDQAKDKPGLKSIDYNHKPTTWGDLGIDPNDPFAARKWNQTVVKEMQGFDSDKALKAEARRQGIT